MFTFALLCVFFQISQGRYINSLFRDGVLLLTLTIKDVSPKHYTTRYLGRPQKIQSQAPDICGYSRICSQWNWCALLLWFPLEKMDWFGHFWVTVCFFLCYGVIPMHLISSLDRLETLIYTYAKGEKGVVIFKLNFLSAKPLSVKLYLSINSSNT